MRTALALLLFLGVRAATRAADSTPVDPPIVLPPFLVADRQDRGVLERIDWAYWQGAGFEVLSGCPEDETERFIHRMLRQREAFSRFIPDDLLGRTTLPTTLILFPQSEKGRIDERLLTEIKGIPQATRVHGNFQPLDDLRLSDPDSSFIFVILDDGQWGWDVRHGTANSQASLLYSPPYLQFLLNARVPALPPWCVTGFTGLYESVVFNPPTVGSLASVRSVPIFSDRPWEHTQFRPEAWTSPTAAAGLRLHPEWPRTLLPLAELFTPQFTAAKSAAYRQTWAAEAELFVRWAYSDRVKGGREALRQFAERLATEPPSEEAFQSAFGLRYADARDALSDFLTATVQHPQDFHTDGESLAQADVTLRHASPAQVRRIKGEWSRRALRVVQANYPVALPLYAAEARLALQEPFDEGERDPQLVASLALLDLDQGLGPRARALLEQFPDAVAARPLAAVALARLRFQAGAAPEDVLAALAGLPEVAPPLEAAYTLEAQAFSRAHRDPDATERVRLNEGARLFPRNSQLVVSSASWDLRAGDSSAAAAVILNGKAEARDPAMRERLGLLEELSAALPAASPSGLLPVPIRTP